MAKILFFSAYPGFSGSHKMALQIAKGCQCAGHQVLLAAPGPMEFLDRAEAEGMEATVLSVHPDLLKFGKVLLNASTPRKFWFLLTRILPCNWRARKLLRLEKVDIVYAAQERAVVMVGLGAKLAGVDLLWHLQSGLKAGSGMIHRMSRVLSTRIVCVSKAVEETAREAFGADTKASLKVIHNGIPDIEMHAAQGEIANNPFRILFAGTLVPDKGVHHLIDAVAEIVRETDHSLKVAIAGTSPDDRYLTYLRSRIADGGLEGVVDLLGFRDDIPALIENSDVVICPSLEQECLITEHGEWDVDWKEGFCLVALEAMRSGKPAIVSDSYGLKEVVKDGETGLRVRPGDRHALQEAIKVLIGKPEMAATFGRNGRKRFKAQFSEKAMTDAFLGEFERMLAPE